MNCKKCKQELQPTWVACPYCGAQQKRTVSKPTIRHGNGQGGVVKMPNGTYKARVTVGWTEDGKPIRHTKSGFRTKAEALAAVESIKHPNVVVQTVTLGALYDQWEDFYSPRISDVTMKTYIAAFKHFSGLRHKPLQDITIDDLQSCVDVAVEDGLGRSTLNNMRTVISLLYEYADLKKVQNCPNIAHHLYVSQVQKGTRKPISESELETIRQAIGTETYASYIYCLCYLGYRPGELLEMKKSSYNTQKHFFVGGKKTEAGKNRIVTVSPKILSLVEQQLATPGQYMFPRLDAGHEGQRMTDSHFNRSVFKPLMKRLGLSQDLSPYSGRHTFANKLKGVTGSDTDKASLIGHADASMTKYYQSADLDSLRKITDTIQ